ncbi:YcnI family protein [Streptomyces sp. WM6386]|uniref:YcnI family copper-binding membrane protein n=1 Tax=Streptomyces sp. WM6386 TaxID=1415558 RepID=UPI0006198959|nr:YcnI family protein [Streptomyces sp. WM6386]KKD09571.1 membrane protein [Streptomyces sp. WM6386]
MKVSRLAAVGAIAASAVVVLSSPAFAHVSVQPEGTAAKGGYAVIDFKVPNERDNASTTKLEVTFPTEHPLASAMPEPVNGWDIKVTKSKLAKPIELHGKKISEAVSKITWTADGKGIQPGFFEKFPVSVGTLPEDADELVFKAIQTYSNKEVVRWIEVEQEGQEEPENPAPVLALSAASEDGHHGASATEEASDDTADDTEKAAAETAAPVDSSDTTARVLGVVGIAVGVVGVAYGVLAGRRRTTDA